MRESNLFQINTADRSEYEEQGKLSLLSVSSANARLPETRCDRFIDGLIDL